MPLIYPTRPLVTDDPLLLSAYNRHPDSRFFMTSRCLSSAEVGALLDQGARFDDLILINGAGEALAQRVAPAEAHDPALHVGIVRLQFSAGVEAVQAIHQWFRSLRNAAFRRGSYIGVTEGNVEAPVSGG